MMTYDEFMKKVLEVFPNATVEEDTWNNLVIYPDLVHHTTPFGEFVKPYEDEE